eukprot:3855816-Rhodomonas_salina.3
MVRVCGVDSGGCASGERRSARRRGSCGWRARSTCARTAMFICSASTSERPQPRPYQRPSNHIRTVQL